MINPHNDQYKNEDISQCPFMSKKQPDSPFNEKINMQSTEKKTHHKNGTDKNECPFQKNAEDSSDEDKNK